MGLAEILVGLVALAWLGALIWSVGVILTTDGDVWRAAGMSRVLWLVVVIVMPLVGSGLFLVFALPRLTAAIRSTG